MVTVLLTATIDVVMSKAGDAVWPSATVTDAGTAAAAGSLLVSCTSAPPAGATPVSVTVLPVLLAPPTTDVDATFTAERVAGATVSTACLLPPL
jgi:hypothetical protein